MRRHIIRAVVTLNTAMRTPAIPRQIRYLHITSPVLKKSKFNEDKHKRGKQNEKEEQEDAKASQESSGADIPAFPVLYIQQTLNLDHDPLDLDILIQQLTDSVAHFKKSAYAIKAGQSDPALIRALQVELPEELGGKMNFSDLANVGPKPGEARSLLITVFDAEYTKHIVRAIAQNHPNLNPQPAPKNDMQLVIPLPPMTKQTRLDNQKKLKDFAEKQKTIIQNIRQKHMKLIKAASKDDPTLGEDIVKKVLKDVDKEVQKTFGEVTKITEKVSDDIMAA